MNDAREAGQVWILKAWPSSLFCLLYLDGEQTDLETEVWAVMNIETGELHDAAFNVKIPTKNRRVT